MLNRRPAHRSASWLFLSVLLATWPVHADPATSDLFSTSGEYDQFAVGGTHRWYDHHTTEAKQKSSHCLSILDEAKVYQDKAFALYAQAKQPGLGSTQVTALRRQGMEQIRLRENKIRAFIECFNQANRRKNPRSDQFATGGNAPRGDNPQTLPGAKSSPPPRKRGDNGQKQLPGPTQKPGSDDQGTPSDVFSAKGNKTPSDDVQTQAPSDQPYGSGSDEIWTGPNADPKSLPPSPEGGKSITRTPKFPSRSQNHPRRTVFDQAIDDCFKKSVPNYRGPDWSRFPPESLRPKQGREFEQSFIVSGVAAEQALQLDEAVYGKWNDRELMQDYLIGWLTHCLSEKKTLPYDDPRPFYEQFMQKDSRDQSQHPTRQQERNERFFSGYTMYPTRPFWDRAHAGPPSPSQ